MGADCYGQMFLYRNSIIKRVLEFALFVLKKIFCHLIFLQAYCKIYLRHKLIVVRSDSYEKN